MLRKRFIWWATLPIVCVIVASWFFSLALEGGSLSRSLSAGLAATFGRPVEVAHVRFTIFGGPKFEADSFTVGEDARFGREYFLRADRLTASLRWVALLHGRIEFDRLSLSRPSLNLVRSADGRWNVESWLPPVNERRSLELHRLSANVPERTSRIDIEAGRINFKKGTEKLPFALVDVSGSLNLQSAGRWLLDLQAHPMRAAVVLQRSGTLHLRGTIGATSARLQPAELRLSWEGASLADAARLARGTDYGLRGLLDADFAARIDRKNGEESGGPWKIEGGVRLQGIHRWDLAARADNPAVNLKLAASWRPARPRLEMEQWVLEAPHSSLDGGASFDWSHGFDPEIHLLDSQIGFPDLVAWSRAFFPRLAEDLEVAGSLGLQGGFGGWPLRIDDLTMSSGGASVRSGSRGLSPIRIVSLRASWNRAALVLAPVAVRLFAPSLGRVAHGAQSEPTAAEGLFHIEGVLGPLGAGAALHDWPYRLAISGQTGRLQDLRAAVAALGWQFAPSWTIEGPASLQLVCAGALRPGASLIHGQLDLRKLRVTSSAISEPIVVSAASVEFSQGERRIQISGAQTLGVRWRGGLGRRAANADWTFDLSAGRLDLEKFAQGLGRGRQDLLHRLLPFGAPLAGDSGLAPQTEAAIARIRANGRVHVDELELGALRLESVDAGADLERGRLTLGPGQADLYGGRVRGEFRAQLGSELRYNFQGQIDRTDLSALAVLASTKNRFAGIGSGEVELAAHGFGRQALLASLEGEGFLHLQDAIIGLLDLPLDPVGSSFQDIAGNRFRSSTVSFRVEHGQIRVDPWLLSGRQRQLEIVGDIDFSRHLNLQVRSISHRERLGPASESSPGDDLWVIGGTLDAPRLVREERVSAGNQSLARTARR